MTVTAFRAFRRFFSRSSRRVTAARTRRTDRKSTSYRDRTNRPRARTSNVLRLVREQTRYGNSRANTIATNAFQRVSKFVLQSFGLSAVSRATTVIFNIYRTERRTNNNDKRNRNWNAIVSTSNTYPCTSVNIDARNEQDIDCAHAFNKNLNNNHDDPSYRGPGVLLFSDYSYEARVCVCLDADYASINSNVTRNRNRSH